MGARCAVLGASGYSGAELLRLLAGHPALEPAAVAAGTRAGDDLVRVQPHLAGAYDLPLVPLEEAASAPVDVVFSCLPPGVLGGLADGLGDAIVVDLSDEHRADHDWVYGLTEFARHELRGATHIANPGCYPTAVLLALTPFLAAGAVGSPAVVDAISGVSGAGRKAEDRLLFSSLFGSAAAYGTTAHRHVPEMERHLARLSGERVTVSFTPHLASFARGLVATVRAPLVAELDDDGALAILADAYADEPFVAVVPQWPETKAVAGSNMAHVSARIDPRAGFVVASAAIDNLGKGAAGQALQNANIALGLEETLGLGALGVWP